MKYITNIAEYINPDVINYVKTHTGDIRPKTVLQDYQKDIYEKWISAGYDLSKIRWEFFNSDNIPNCNLKFPFEGEVSWWISKLCPGDMFPFHIDTFPGEQKVTRYWIACEDHEPGHIFMYDNQVLSNYKAGDVFEITPGLWHGAANIGFTTKLSLQLVVV